MTLATRIIPVLLKRGDTLVKGESFRAWRVVGHVEQAARVHQARGVDELCILDIAATQERRGPDLQAIERLTAGCFMPITVGGGVRNVDDVRALLRVGADKVVIRTAGVPAIAAASRAVGRQAIVAAIDVDPMEVDIWKPLSPESRAHLCELAVKRTRMMVEAGAGEILLTNCDLEGTLKGYDLELIRAVSAAVDVPVIAHGGCGSYIHMLEAVKVGASAVAAGAMFQFTDATPKGAAQFLHQFGIEVRL